MSKKERIILGSGQVYLVEFANAFPEVDTICVEDNRLGYISGGATLEYKPSFYQAKDEDVYKRQAQLIL